MVALRSFLRGGLRRDLVCGSRASHGGQSVIPEERPNTEEMMAEAEMGQVGEPDADISVMSTVTADGSMPVLEDEVYASSGGAWRWS